VMLALEDLKGSAPHKQIPFTAQFRTEFGKDLGHGLDLCYPRESFQQPGCPQFVEWVQADVPQGLGYRLEQWGTDRGARWVYKFADYPSLKAGAVAQVAQFLQERAINGLHDGEVIMVEDLSGKGILATQWTPRDFLAPWTRSVTSWKPTEAIYRAYSLANGKLCWSGELEDWGFRSGAIIGHEAIEFATSQLQMPSSTAGFRARRK